MCSELSLASVKMCILTNEMAVGLFSNSVSSLFILILYIYISLFAHTSYKVVHRKCNCIQTEYMKR